MPTPAEMTQDGSDWAGMRAARAFAYYHLGDSDWADLIVHAYLNPGPVIEQLRKEKAEN